MTNEISAQAIESLKREAKRARRTDPSRTHTQHLNALAADRFGVRDYHELVKRASAPPVRLGLVVSMELAGLGTGKTTILLNLAGFLATQRCGAAPYRVVLVDCDHDSMSGLLDNRPPHVPALPFDLTSLPLTEFVRQSDEFRRKYDFILFDAPAVLEPEVVTGTLADIVLMPTNMIASGWHTLLERQFVARPNQALTAQFYMFGARTLPGTEAIVLERINHLINTAPHLAGRIQVLPICIPEHPAVSNATQHGAAAFDIDHPAQSFLNGIGQLGQVCIQAKATVLRADHHPHSPPKED